MMVVTAGAVRHAKLQSDIATNKPPNFYRLDTLPIAKAMLSKH